MTRESAMSDPVSDVLDDIDSLIDEQLDAGEPLGGYDYGDPDYPKCWHCGRDWHGLAITERMRDMRWRGVMDDGYRYADDDSRVICPGSEFIGPMPPSRRDWILGYTTTDPFTQYQAVGEAFISFGAQMRGFTETLRAQFDELSRLLNPASWTVQLGPWTQPEPDPVAEVRAALSEIDYTTDDGWQRLDGFIYEIAEPEPDEDAAERLRHIVETSTTEEGPVRLGTKPDAPFWVPRADGRRR